jgi:hypothetical protein
VDDGRYVHDVVIDGARIDQFCVDAAGGVDRCRDCVLVALPPQATLAEDCK